MGAVRDRGHILGQIRHRHKVVVLRDCHPKREEPTHQFVLLSIAQRSAASRGSDPIPIRSWPNAFWYSLNKSERFTICMRQRMWTTLSNRFSIRESSSPQNLGGLETKAN